MTIASRAPRTARFNITVSPLQPQDFDRFAIQFDHQLRSVHRARLEQQQRGDACYLVAWNGAEMAGHALLLWRPKDRIAPREAGPLLELKDVYTHPDSRRQGVGHALIRAAERQAATLGLTRLGLGVVPDNHGALRLYELTGFTPFSQDTFDIHERFEDDDGQIHDWHETVLYLIRDLPAQPASSGPSLA